MSPICIDLTCLGQFNSFGLFFTFSLLYWNKFKIQKCKKFGQQISILFLPNMISRAKVSKVSQHVVLRRVSLKMITLQEIFFCHCTSRQLAGPITTMVVCVMKLVPILVILVVLCGFLALEGQAKKVKKQNTKVRFGKISSGGWQFSIFLCFRQLLSKKNLHGFFFVFSERNNCTNVHFDKIIQLYIRFSQFNLSTKS